MNLRHITRFTYKYTNFQGWRVAINRQGTTLARYFSDKQYGSEEEAREQALHFRDMLLDELNQNPGNTREILDKYRVQPQKPYPAGLKPGNTKGNDEQSDTEQKVGACSIRSNQVMHRILRNVCHRLQLDTASVLKLSLYMFALQYKEQTAIAEELATTEAMHSPAYLPEQEQPEATLQRLVSELEHHARLAGLPSFEEFSTGKTSPLPRQPHNTMHNTSPPTQDPPTMHPLSLRPHVNPPRPPHPSPPALNQASTFLSSSLSAARYRLSLTAQHNSSPTVATTAGAAHHIKKPTRFAQGTAHSNPPPPNLI